MKIDIKKTVNLTNRVVISLSSRKCNTCLVLTSEQGFLESMFWVRTFCPNASMVHSTLFFYSTSFWIWCKEYRPGCAPVLPVANGSCMIVHQNIFRLWCIAISMLHIPGMQISRGEHVAWNIPTLLGP